MRVGPSEPASRLGIPFSKVEDNPYSNWKERKRALRDEKFEKKDN
jgi:hypothetical protein